MKSQGRQGAKNWPLELSLDFRSSALHAVRLLVRYPAWAGWSSFTLLNSPKGQIRDD